MFALRVKDFLRRSGGEVDVVGLKGKPYHVRLNEATNEVELLDRPYLKPINLAVFDQVEICLDWGLTTKGYSREKLGSPKLNEQTIMYYVAKFYYGTEENERIKFDASCYIFALLTSAGCVHSLGRRSGEIEKIR